MIAQSNEYFEFEPTQSSVALTLEDENKELAKLLDEKNSQIDKLNQEIEESKEEIRLLNEAHAEIVMAGIKRELCFRAVVETYWKFFCTYFRSR